MRAGRMRHRVAIQSPSTAVDSFGEQTDSWSTDATVWASIEPLSGREAQVAKQTNPRLSHRVLMRHRTGVTPRQRLVFGTGGDARTYEIAQVINPDERNISLRIMCVEEL